GQHLRGAELVEDGDVVRRRRADGDGDGGAVEGEPAAAGVELALVPLDLGVGGQVGPRNERGLAGRAAGATTGEDDHPRRAERDREPPTAHFEKSLLWSLPRKAQRVPGRGPGVKGGLRPDRQG